MAVRFQIALEFESAISVETGSLVIPREKKQEKGRKEEERMKEKTRTKENNIPFSAALTSIQLTPVIETINENHQFETTPNVITKSYIYCPLQAKPKVLFCSVNFFMFLITV